MEIYLELRYYCSFLSNMMVHTWNLWWFVRLYCQYLLLKRISVIGLSNYLKYVPEGRRFKPLFFSSDMKRFENTSDAVSWWKHIHSITSTSLLVMLQGLKASFLRRFCTHYPCSVEIRFLQKSIYGPSTLYTHTQFYFRLMILFRF